MRENEKDTRRQSRQEHDREMDDFWDVDSLIPTRRAPAYPSNTETAEIVIEPKEPKNAPAAPSVTKEESLPKREDAPVRHFIPPHTAAEESRVAEPDEEYEPDNTLIRRVRLFRWKNEYRYYEAFWRDAVRLYSIHGQECSRVPFFSYVPQYSQMTRGQLEWYLWWRENLREGRALATDYSYLLLYAYELINLSDRVSPLETRDAMYQLWHSYRQTFRQLDSILPEWICDMSLIHRLSLPEKASQNDLGEAMRHCALREYYVRSDGTQSSVKALLSFCSNYDYHKSKFCTSESLELFDHTVTGALQELIDRFSGDGKLFSSAGMDDSKMIRDAYSGAICSYRLKRKIEVEYCSFSRSHELRFLITDVIKYTENRLRASLGVRSRLTVYSLPTAVTMVLDEYLDRVVPNRRGAGKTAVEPQTAEYERLYDLPSRPLSFAAAAEIEELSWGTTQKLVEAFEEKEQKNFISAPTPMPLCTPNPVSGLEPEPSCTVSVGQPLYPYFAFLQGVLEGDREAQRREAEKLGRLLDVVADEINSLAADLYGDILLEEDGDAYAVIDEYRELAKELLQSANGKEMS